MKQLALPLDYRSADGEADFLVSSANRAAVDWFDLWPEWPSPCALLIGPAASGKSHLARIFARRSGAMVIDDADAADPESVFHAWNAATVAQPLLLTSALLPRSWPQPLADLQSRLTATPLFKIFAPDDALLAGLFAKLFRDRGLSVAGEVAEYVLARIDRSFASVAIMVDALDTAALAAGRPLTVPLARSVLTAQSDWIEDAVILR